jgi:polysaccharide export outer membrane protein
VAEGVTLAADLRRVQVRRKTASGKDQVITLNLWELRANWRQAARFKLRDGDSIYVPTATTVNLAETRQLATTRFAPPLEKPRTVAVVGEVNRPGSYVVIGGKNNTRTKNAGNSSVTRAIDLAGGIKPLADVRRVQLRRLTKSGTETTASI